MKTKMNLAYFFASMFAIVAVFHAPLQAAEIRVEIAVKGMVCKNCEESVVHTIKNMKSEDGKSLEASIYNVTASHTKRLVVISYDGDVIKSPDGFLKIIRDMGYTAEKK